MESFCPLVVNHLIQLKGGLRPGNFSPEETNLKFHFTDGCVLSFIRTLWEMLVNERYFREKIKIAQSKAAGSGRKEKSRHVQEPPRKDGKCMHLLKNKIKTWKISV